MWHAWAAVNPRVTLTPAPLPAPPTPPPQMEVDFKAECLSGELIESLAARAPLEPALAQNGAGPAALSFVHALRRCEGEVCTELVRARTTFRAGEPPQAC